MRNRLLLKYYKIDKMRFIGHLDLQNIMQRAVKRGKLPVAYSKGFNPHQLISFACPLSIGVAGLSEYLEIELNEKTEISNFIDVLNNNLPDGVKILDAREMSQTEKGPASLLTAALFNVVLPSAKQLDDHVNNILNSKEILVNKQTKSSEQIDNIRKDIFEIKVTDNNTMELLIAQGSQRNLKPELIMKYLCENMQTQYSPFETNITRKELYKCSTNENKAHYTSLFQADF